ncbi:MAG: hypothetical protein AB1918_03480 [Pseudomonadota bacterium]
MYISRILAVQERVQKEQLQVTSEKKSLVYSGISRDVNRLLNFENQKATANRFLQNNIMAGTKLDAASTSIEAARKNITDLRDRLDTFARNMPTEKGFIDEIQKYAWEALVEMHSYLSTTVDGQYIFSGGRVSTSPVKLPASSLSEFQSIFDGETIKTPTTRAAALQEVSLNRDQTGEVTFNPATGTLSAANAGAFSDVHAGSQLTIGGVVPSRTLNVKSVDSTGTTLSFARFTSEVAASATVTSDDGTLVFDNTKTGALTFSPDGDTITAATAGAFANLPVGTVFRVAGTTGNDGVYTVAAKDATNTSITITSASLDFAVANTAETAGTLASVPPGVTVAPGAYGSLAISSNSSDQITFTATTGGSLAGLTAGMTFTLTGSEDIDGDGSAENDGTYKVISNDGTTMAVTRVGVGSASFQTTSATFTSESWYRGDTIGLKHRVDDNREVDVGIYASDPAFEKAIRAMYLIAQGQFGTAGGLDNNMERVDQARWLLNDAIESPASSSPPFGTEETSDLQSLHSQIGVTQNIIKSKNEKHQSFVGFLDKRIIDMENVNMTEAIALLLDDQRALEAGYQALAKVREQSLMDYLR